MSEGKGSCVGVGVAVWSSVGGGSERIGGDGASDWGVTAWQARRIITNTITKRRMLAIIAAQTMRYGRSAGTIYLGTQNQWGDS